MRAIKEKKRLSVIRYVGPDADKEITALAHIFRVTNRQVHYALRGESLSPRSLRIRTAALRRGHCVDTRFLADGTKAIPESPVSDLPTIDESYGHE